MKVKLKKYNPKWNYLFEIEKEKLLIILGSTGIKIEHIGSTSIPDICSKPVIDIMIGVEKEKQLDNNINKILTLGYTYVQKYEIFLPFRRYFFKLKNHDVKMKTVNIINAVSPEIELIEKLRNFSSINYSTIK